MIFPALLSTNPSSSPRLSLLTQLMSQNLNPQYRMHAISPQPTQNPSRIQDAFRWFLQLKKKKKNTNNQIYKESWRFNFWRERSCFVIKVSNISDLFSYIL